MAFKAQPIGDRIIVRAEAAKETLDSGLIIPQSGQKPQRCGEVLAVGPGNYNSVGELVPLTLKPGDRILFGSYAGVAVSIDGESYQIMREGDVAAVLDPGAVVETDGLSMPRSSKSSFYA